MRSRGDVSGVDEARGVLHPWQVRGGCVVQRRRSSDRGQVSVTAVFFQRSLMWSVLVPIHIKARRLQVLHWGDPRPAALCRRRDAVCAICVCRRDRLREHSVQRLGDVAADARKMGVLGDGVFLPCDNRDRAAAVSRCRTRHSPRQKRGVPRLSSGTPVTADVQSVVRSVLRHVELPPVAVAAHRWDARRRHCGRHHCTVSACQRPCAVLKASAVSSWTSCSSPLSCWSSRAIHLARRGGRVPAPPRSNR